MLRSGPDPSRRGGRWRVRRLVCAALTVSAVMLAASVPAVPARAATTFAVAQMNLCNSGMAINSCYSFGKAVDEAVEKIHRYSPDLVTLQEICRDDLYAPGGWGKLARAMADRHGSRHISVDFAPAWNRYTNEGYRCVNGQQFGVGLIHHGNGRDLHHGWYASQDPSDEMRVWTCATVIARRLTGCTTHLSIDADVALRQCRELASILTSSWVMPEVIVAGDFNLISKSGTRFNVQDCAAPNYDRRDDGALQHVFFTRNIQWVHGSYEGMKWTDHPLLYERFRV
jgi:endonuclease/exonuclease/phosphatase family metal-dependent hydrolase